MAIGFLKNFLGRLREGAVDWDELEETLIRADLGAPLAMRLVEGLRDEGGGAPGARTVEQTLKKELAALFPDSSPPLHALPTRPKVLLLLGVNGTGKTTTAAKLAAVLKGRRHSVLLVAADTFRAAATEQLVAWGERLGIEVATGKPDSDPAALCHDACQMADRRNFEFLICDTAGRLHTKHNLMQELSKVTRTISRVLPGAPDEKWLVIDAGTGTNGLVQAREFHAAVGLTGVILTKVDGSGRGGIAAAIQHELGIAPRFLGTGEGPGDLDPFDRHKFVERLV